MSHKGDIQEILPRAGFKPAHKALRHATPQQRPPHERRRLIGEERTNG